MRKAPLRKCIGCSEMKDKRQLIRVVRNKEQEFFIDITGKQNGRGAYICPEKECLEKAIKNKGVEKSFKSVIPKEKYSKLKKEFYNLE
jgi:predicted RNA-binding protein YlxR (DUF448 family)